MGADLYISEIYDVEKYRFKPFTDLSLKIRDGLYDSQENKARELENCYYFYEYINASKSIKQFLIDHPEHTKDIIEWDWEKSIDYIINVIEKFVEKHYNNKTNTKRLSKKEAKNIHDESQKFLDFFSNKEEENGYFRDSYNDSSILWRLGLSWWQDVIGYGGDNSGLIDENGYIRDENLHIFYKMIEKSTLNLPNDEWFKNNDYPKDEYRKYWINKKQKLLNFIKRAIDNNQSIYASC